MPLLVCPGAVKESATMHNQLVAGTVKEKFDEHSYRVLLLKGQVIQLERQVSGGGGLVLARVLRASRQGREAVHAPYPIHE